MMSTTCANTSGIRDAVRVGLYSVSMVVGACAGFVALLLVA